jgi:hypothetical protein
MRKTPDHPPFDLVFCRDDPNGEIIFAFTDDTYELVTDLFPVVQWTTEQHGWHVASVFHSYASEMAPVATKAGLRVGFGEYRDGVLTFRPVEVVPNRRH